MSAARAPKRKKKRNEAKAPAPVPKPRFDWPEIGRAYGLLLFGAVLMFIGFAGFGIWPLAFVGMVPALWVFDARPQGFQFFRRALFFGYVAFTGGFYWIVTTIVDFGGFPWVVSILFASVYFLYQGFEYVLVTWLWRRARDRGWNATLALVAAFVGTEHIYPQLFDNYYGNSFHMLPPLIQVADLGGPLMLSAISMAGNGAAYEVVRALIRKERIPRAAPAVFAGLLAFYLGYGYWRIHDTEARMAAAPRLTIGVVQANMGIFEKWEEVEIGHQRHVEQSLALEREAHPDLIIWPESAVASFIPESMHNVRRPILTNPRGESIQTATIFGGLERRVIDGRARAYNTAFLTDADGNVRGTYDKTYLLAFGEYIPFGDWFPWVYDVSRNSGQFTPGDSLRPLPYRDYRISTLICYEDILPGFVRRAVSAANPHLLVNITNDSWFGDTQEPYVHLALAKFRAVEHHRFLVRATNTGVSAIIDPSGRVTTQGPTFQRASLHGEVRMLTGWTPYESMGDWLGYLALAAIAWMVFAGRRRLPEDELERKSPAKPVTDTNGG